MTASIRTEHLAKAWLSYPPVRDLHALIGRINRQKGGKTNDRRYHYHRAHHPRDTMTDDLEPLSTDATAVGAFGLDCPHCGTTLFLRDSAAWWVTADLPPTFPCPSCGGVCEVQHECAVDEDEICVEWLEKA